MNNKDNFLGIELRYPSYRPVSAWALHGPFANWLVKAARPNRIVELGVHNGYSYFAFCESVVETGLQTECFAVDNWTGDEHSGFYGDDVFSFVMAENFKYKTFSNLVRKSFEAALTDIEDGSVDLLHIDGRHRYEDVKYDFESWQNKLSNKAIVLFHDTNVKASDFGVSRYWDELTETYPNFQFFHGNGLGILFWGTFHSPEITEFISLSQSKIGAMRISISFFSFAAKSTYVSVKKYILIYVRYLIKIFK